MTEEQKPKRGRPRIHANRQQAWKDRTGYESTDARKAYKREWAKADRLKKKT